MSKMRFSVCLSVEALPPERWSVGASFNGSRGQSLACYRSGSIASNTVWQLRNQPPSNMWLGATGGTVTVPPGKSAVIDAVLSGFGYAPWHTDPFVGILRLLTNDPIQPQVSLSAQANVGAPPYNMALPVVSR